MVLSSPCIKSLTACGAQLGTKAIAKNKTEYFIMLNFLFMSSMILANPLALNDLPYDLQYSQKKTLCLISCPNSICNEVLNDLNSMGYEVGMVSCTIPSDVNCEMMWSMYFYKGGARARPLLAERGGPSAPEDYEPERPKGANGPKGPCNYLID